jgi:hypothetical protein
MSPEHSQTRLESVGTVMFCLTIIVTKDSVIIDEYLKSRVVAG